MPTRREFLALTAAGAISPSGAAEAPQIDTHVHIGDGVTVDRAVEIARGVE